MIWQDIILMVGGLGFSIALIPTVRGKAKPAKLTCLMTGSILAAFAVVYGTLGLWLAFGGTVATTAMWFVLLFQQIKKQRRK